MTSTMLIFIHQKYFRYSYKIVNIILELAGDLSKSKKWQYNMTTYLQVYKNYIDTVWTNITNYAYYR